MRILYSANLPCQAGCKYCFAKWNDIYSGQPRLNEDKLDHDDKQAIIYPCCDGEFFDQRNLVDVVERYAETMDKVYVSISTKRWISDDDLHRLVQLNNHLVATNKGFVKFSISLSNKSRLMEIEPNTMSYAERLDLAKRISETSMPKSLTLKPILPFISEEEYFEVVEDFGFYLQHILLGGLYINRNSDFFVNYIKGNWDVGHRKVEWLLNAPEWDYIVQQSKIAAIRDFSQSQNISVFDSDIDLIKAYIQKIEIGGLDE